MTHICISAHKSFPNIQDSDMSLKIENTKYKLDKEKDNIQGSGEI